LWRVSRGTVKRAESRTKVEQRGSVPSHAHAHARHPLPMTVGWGGADSGLNYINTGGRYNPSTDTWAATTTTNAPERRWYHTAVWTGTEMIIWGGYGYGNPYLITGGRYNPSVDSWTATSTIDPPLGRGFHSAVWSGSGMIVWGGVDEEGTVNTGGIYCAQSGPTPTPTPTPTPCAGRCTPTPRPRPTPHPRPTSP
jgi:hypothetical protein